MFDFNEVRPDLGEAIGQLFGSLKAARQLPDRLVELIRLRIAFHNQCRYCMSIRYSDGVKAGVSEDLVCSLEVPGDASDLTAAEKTAVAFADRFANNHQSIGQEQLDALALHYSEAEIAELAMLCGVFVAFGRIRSILDQGEELPVGYKQNDALLAPWGINPLVVE